ncbi:MAG: LPXTG cell wall anchor domain-containing protein, partial [Ilumatobacteraceae bacterium]
IYLAAQIVSRSFAISEVTTTTVPVTTTTVPVNVSSAPVTATTVPVNVSSAPSLAVINALPRALLSTTPMFTGGKITVAYTGFTPGEIVQLIVASMPRVIGTGVAKASGSVTVTEILPSGLGAGKHTIALYAPISGAGFRQVVSVSAATLPQTGSNSPPLVAGMMMVISGVVLMASRRRASLRIQLNR